MSGDRRESAPVIPPPLGFVVVGGVGGESAEGFQDAHLFALADVFIQGSVDCFFLGLVFSGPSGFFDESVVQCEVSGHV